MSTAAFFDYDSVEDVPPFLIFTKDGEWVAAIRKDQKVTATPLLTIRDAGDDDERGKLLLKRPITEHLNLRELKVSELATPVKIKVYDSNKQQIGSDLIFKHNFDFRFRDAKPIVVPGEVPIPGPTPGPDPEDIVEYRVIWDKGNPPGMNVRVDHDANSAKVGELPTGAIVECDESRFFIGDTIGWLPIVGPTFAGYWVAFYSFVPGEPFNIVDEFLIPAADYVEPEPLPTGTVQLTGKIKLEKRPDGHTRLTNVPAVGFNLRSAIHYTKPEWQDLTLDWMRDNDFKWVRAYVAREGVSLQDCLNRTGVFVNKCKSRGIHVCLVVTDSLRDSGHIIDEMIPWHSGPKGHVHYEFFTKRQYTKDYYNWVNAVAAEFGQDVSMIDVMNEPALYPRAGGHLTISQDMTDAYIDCFAEACHIVYSRTNGEVPSTVGWINANHFRPADKDGLQHARETAKRMKWMQGYSAHLYAEPVEIDPSYHPDASFRFEADTRNMDLIAAKEAGQAFVFGEFGSYESNEGRARSIRNFRTRNPEVEIQWYWGVCPLVQGQNKDIVVNTGDCDGHSLTLGRDGEGEFWDCIKALKG